MLRSHIGLLRFLRDTKLWLHKKEKSKRLRSQLVLYGVSTETLTLEPDGISREIARTTLSIGTSLQMLPLSSNISHHHWWIASMIDQSMQAHSGTWRFSWSPQRMVSQRWKRTFRYYPAWIWSRLSRALHYSRTRSTCSRAMTQKR